MFRHKSNKLRAYAEAELDRAIRGRPGWHAESCRPDWFVMPTDQKRLDHSDFWLITQDSSNGSYLLEAASESKEFLVVNRASVGSSNRPSTSRSRISARTASRASASHSARSGSARPWRSFASRREELSRGLRCDTPRTTCR